MSKYTDGEYTVEGAYGSKSIVVKLKLNSNKIQQVTVTPNTTIPRSLKLQTSFAAAIGDEVIGRPIDEVHLDKLAGSSLTTKGFNDALEKIKAQASQ
jgi:uncharacterized protein with FMN-binding domain